MPANNSRDTVIRQWKLLQLVPKQPASISVSDLHQRLKDEGYTVSRRTVERDLQKLLESGFPLVFDDSQEPYLWSWSRQSQSFTLPLPSVTDALLLVMVRDNLKALLPPNIVDVLQPYVARAEAVLAEARQHNRLANWKDKVRVAQPTQPLIAPPVDPSVRATLCEALLQETQVQIEYAGRTKSKTSQLLVHPHALLQRGPVSYLIGTCGDFTDLRRLALHRVRKAVNTYAPMKRVAGFDLDQHLRDGFGDFGSGVLKSIELLVAPGVAEHLMECKLSTDQKLAPADEPPGWFRLSATVADTPQLTWWLRGFGKHVIVKNGADIDL